MAEPPYMFRWGAGLFFVPPVILAPALPTAARERASDPKERSRWIFPRSAAWHRPPPRKNLPVVGWSEPAAGRTGVPFCGRRVSGERPGRTRRKVERSQNDYDRTVRGVRVGEHTAATRLGEGVEREISSVPQIPSFRSGVARFWLLA